MSGGERNETRSVKILIKFLLVVVYILIPVILTFPCFGFMLNHLVSVGIVYVCVGVSGIYWELDDVNYKPKKLEKASSEKKGNWQCKWDDCELFKLQYEQLSEGIRSRDSMTIIAGSEMDSSQI